jgi:hypothetical protein
VSEKQDILTRIVLPITTLVGLGAVFQQFVSYPWWIRYGLGFVALLLAASWVTPLLRGWVDPKMERPETRTGRPFRIAVALVMLIISGLVSVWLAHIAIELTALRIYGDQPGTMVLSASAQPSDVTVSLPPNTTCAPAVPEGTPKPSVIVEGEGTAIPRILLREFVAPQVLQLTCPADTQLSDRMVVVEPATQQVLAGSHLATANFLGWIGGLFPWIGALGYLGWRLRSQA